MTSADAIPPLVLLLVVAGCGGGGGGSGPPRSVDAPIALERVFPALQFTRPVALLQGYISVWMTLACLALGQRLLDRQQRWLQPLAEASYWTYVVHLPILFAIQYQLLDVEAPWWAKLIVAVLATLALCLLSYRLLVRRSPLGSLFGRSSTAPAATVG